MVSGKEKSVERMRIVVRTASSLKMKVVRNVYPDRPIGRLESSMGSKNHSQFWSPSRKSDSNLCTKPCFLSDGGIDRKWNSGAHRLYVEVSTASAPLN